MSSRISRKRDLIVRIDLERSYQGMPIAEVRELEKKLQRMPVDELAVLYKKLLGERKAGMSERENTGETETGRSSLA